MSSWEYEDKILHHLYHINKLQKRIKANNDMLREAKKPESTSPYAGHHQIEIEADKAAREVYFRSLAKLTGGNNEVY
tara:strand:- start:665 stop:895 length:231 start_codon:yes stop_codon:yes gene_type:complete